LVAEVRTRAFLASLVPVIVNTVLNEHQLVLDIVAFVAFGDFPKSRLGEKQRGKVLGNWVSRKMRTIAQFSIRDPDAEGSVSTVGPEDSMGRRRSGQSGIEGGGSMTRMLPNSSLRNSASITHMPVAEEPSEMNDDENILTLHTQHPGPPPERSDSRNDATPTNERPMQLSTETDYSPVDDMSFDSPIHLRRGDAQYDYQMRASYGAPPEAYNPYDVPDPIPQELEGTVGGLRVANRTSAREGEDWEQEALRSLNLR
jgi:hypothetical protein